jgi:membrane associated rhomboid family serine protease
MASNKQVGPGTLASLRKTGRQVSRSLKRQAVVLGGTFTAFWAVFAVNNLLGGMLNVFGVIPRTSIGLRGIVFAPFIHHRFDHIVANSLPFLALGWMVMLRDARHFVPVTLMSAIGSGLLAWLLGAPGSVHIGASGILFGYLGFLILSGWYARSALSIALSLVVIAVWGGVVLGVMPGQSGVSWQSHLGGFIAGAVAARSYRAK